MRKANEAAKVYYNGVSQPSTRVPWNGAISYAGAWFAIGKQKDLGREFKGFIDDLRVYNRAFSASEVIDLYQDTGVVISVFTATPTVGSALLPVDFICRATSLNGTIVKYMWDVDGDGLADYTTTTGHVIHTYTTNGVFRASVTVEDSEGDRAQSGEQRIKVDNGAELSGKVESYLFNDVHKTVNTTIRIYNTGNTAAGPFEVGLRLDSASVKTVAVSGLGTRQSIPLTISHVFTHSIIYGRTISLIIDSQERVPEIEETNNGVQMIIRPLVTTK